MITKNGNLTPLSEILAEDDVKKIISDFCDEDMADARKLILLWENRKGDILLSTNLPSIRCGQIFMMAFEAIQK